MKDDEVVVDVHYCGMCHSDVHSERERERESLTLEAAARARARTR